MIADLNELDKKTIADLDKYVSYIASCITSCVVIELNKCIKKVEVLLIKKYTVEDVSNISLCVSNLLEPEDVIKKFKKEIKKFFKKTPKKSKIQFYEVDRFPPFISSIATVDNVSCRVVLGNILMKDGEYLQISIFYNLVPQ